MLFKKKETVEPVTLSFDDYLTTVINVYESIPSSVSLLKPKMEAIFSDSYDFSERNFSLPSGQKSYLCYLSGLINEELLDDNVIKPLLHREENIEVSDDFENILTLKSFQPVTTWENTVELILAGNVLLIVNGVKPVVLFLAEKNLRNVADPTTEYQVYGSKLGFIEDSRTNVGIVRQFIQDPRLKTKEYQLGKVSKTHASLVYLEQYVDVKTVETIDSYLKGFNQKHMLSLGQLSKYVSRHPNSIFPQASKTERPDHVAYALTQGKVVLFVDNSTFCLLAPITFMDMLETSEDHSFLVSWNLTFIRLVRLISLLFGSSLPALYVALVAFQPELIPTTLTINVAQSRAQIPLPATAEAFLMLFALDVLVEASIRLPSFVGQTIGIVGGLVIGTAAVEAGIVSNVMVIVIALTAVAIFTLPNWEFVSSWRIVRYAFVLSAASFGLYGLVLAIGFLCLHLAKLDSLGRSYLYPLTPFDGKELKNFFKPQR
ncbi:spore germination protein [Evansella sp. AB-P1]|uniref:spore germination protein n=1 Tax=Evansella sp. AB-P1 TaxID=3037653 RepID=UPI00241D199D|nr:spore germination protein [Evansella sp. AB-P1]MDG5788455.1 spore germination protein [Evansella sp. AB-P1]